VFPQLATEKGLTTMPHAAHSPNKVSTPEVFRLPQDTLDQFMATAYLLHSDGHYLHAELVCRGILAAEPRYWYAAALLQATLEKRAHRARPGRRPPHKPSRRVGLKEAS
jgi:hypothetical protein